MRLSLRIDQYFTVLCLIIIGCIFPLQSLETVQAEDTIQQNTLQLAPSPELFLPFSNESQTAPPFSLTAQSVVVFDVESGTILYQKDIDRPLPIASLTKLMTALITVEQYNLQDSVVITDEHLTAGNTIKLKPGEEILVGNLLKGLLIFSGNDAAVALANHHPEGYQGFIEAMNNKATSLGLSQTSFVNPEGLDNAEQFSTARDLALLMREVMKHPELQAIMSTEMTQITSNDQKYAHMLYNTNQLLGKLEGLRAGKTGSTPLAGECLVTQIRKDQHDIITVVLGSSSRFTETESLVQWIFDNYQWKKIAYDNENEISFVE